jgi:hypothetical protein
MDQKIESARDWFHRIYAEGIPRLLEAKETAFLSFLCVVAATDAIAGYRYASGGVGDRFKRFITNYFPPEYGPHAESLWDFRCRMLHNFSPAYFSLVHASPQLHLQPSSIGDAYLDDRSFFAHMLSAAAMYFAELASDASLQTDMLQRLDDVDRGGAIWVTER